MSTAEFNSIEPIAWSDEEDCLLLLDQTLLPDEETWLHCQKVEDVAGAIKRLSVRGAPAIGVAAAYGLIVGLKGASDSELEARFDQVFEILGSTRPTAVNLRWALENGRDLFQKHKGEGTEACRRILLDWAKKVQAADVKTNQTMGDNGIPLFEEGDRVLTHCNAGALATAGYGTAVGVIASAFREGKIGSVWVDETRPLLQGARLTAWEMEKLGIPYHLVTDSSVGALMSRGLVDRVVVGADRVAANGDAANKIGTYTVAVLAQRHNVPFYVAAPRSTIDPRTPTGADIPIEVRDSEEVTAFGGRRVSPKKTEAMNFAFDVTPNDLIAGIITEVGILRAPYVESIREALASD